MGSTAKYAGYYEHEKPVEVIGYVLSIGTPSDLSHSKESGRRIVINGITRDGDTINITADLSISDYVVACKAHDEGVETKLTGKMNKINTKWVLSSYTDFHIIDYGH
jgi:hypothetical protein